MCEQLDKEKGVEEPEELWFWPKPPPPPVEEGRRRMRWADSINFGKNKGLLTVCHNLMGHLEIPIIVLLIKQSDMYTLCLVSTVNIIYNLQ